jgi:GT2 family glycosyltransferase
LNDFEYIALVNADIKADKKWLEESVKTLRRHPNAYICSSLCLNWKSSLLDNAGGAIVNFLAGIFGGFLSGIPARDIQSRYKNLDFMVLPLPW